MDHARTQDGNCCCLDVLIDGVLGRLSPAEAADDVAEECQRILRDPNSPETRAIVGALESLVMAGYARHLNNKVVTSRGLARTA